MSAEHEDQRRRAQARVGMVLRGKWTLDSLLGLGGMAAVYAATHRNRKRVAIKMLHPELSANRDIRGRFLREGYVANSVRHDGVVHVDDDDVAEDGSAFLVMELLEGETVDQRSERKGDRLPVEEALSIADRVLDVLAAAHAAGIVHRDLKPENLFLTQQGILKVLDFGIARLKELSAPETTTRTGSLMGTPAFMAPEQARGRWDDVDARTDLWALGAVMFTMLSGRVVHQGETANEALALAIMQPAPPLASVEPSVPSVVCSIVDRALSYQKDARFADAREMQQAIREAYAAIAGDAAARPPALSIVELPPLPRTQAVVRSSSAGEGPTMASAVTVSNQERSSPVLSGHFTARRIRPALMLGVAVVSAALALVFMLKRGDSQTASPRPSAEATPRGSAELSPDRTADSVERAVAVVDSGTPDVTAAAARVPSSASARAPGRVPPKRRAVVRGLAEPAPVPADQPDPFAKRR